jgi:transcriptional regulator GlxA family with amidase domain
MTPPRRIAILVFDGIQSLDVTGPLEVFCLASRFTRGRGYSVELISADGLPVQTSSGVTLSPHRSLTACGGDLDTLLVAGGSGAAEVTRDERVIGWLRSAAGRSRRVASVCTGAFVLARAGLLDGRRATTHWASCDRLAEDYPAIDVQRDPIFVRDGNVYTSAGITAGIDLALALVEEDLGAQLALELARWLVLYIRRPAGQAQVGAGLAGQACPPPVITQLQTFIAEHLDADLSVAALAERAFMSPRNLARVFKRELGLTPAGYVESMRLERAQALIEATELQLDEVARRCGFNSAETLRRTFGRRLGASPSEYRAQVVPIRREVAA